MNLTPYLPRRALIFALVVLSIAALGLAPQAHADRALLSSAALETSSQPPFTPPNEGQIEGACGLAITAGGGIYVSDYYHRVIDIYGSFSVPPANTPAKYLSQLALPGANPVFGTNTLDAVCGLAFDPSGHLYANEFHEGVKQLTPTEFTIDEAESTGLAVDASTNRLYVDDRTYIAEYALPIAAEAKPIAKLAVDPSADYYGLAAFEGILFVADASDQTVKVFEPASDAASVHTISAGFNSLTDSALAVDPTNGHLLVVDNRQLLFEHPKSEVREFKSPAEGYADLGSLPGAPIFGAPSGIAVGSNGTVFVTDGNSELSNVFAYGAYGATTLAEPATPASLGSSQVASALSAPVQASAAPLTADQTPPRRKHRHHARRAHRKSRAGGKR
jgi:hypothetical protein